MSTESKFTVGLRVKKLALVSGKMKTIHGTINRIGEHSVQVRWDNMSAPAWDFEENLEVSN